MQSKRQEALAIIVVIVATLLAYAPAMRASFIWDDPEYLTENSLIKSPSGLERIWLEPGATPQYYPLTFTVFALQYQLWGLDPFGYHLVNILLHALNASLLWLLLRRLRVPGAWLGAALFALHPVHVMSVAWITELKNVLSGAFYLSSILAYLSFACPRQGSSSGDPDGHESVLRTPARERKARLYFAALLLHLCAVSGKTTACTMPVIILVVLWWKQDRVAWRDLLKLAPLFAISLASGLMCIWVETQSVGARGSEFDVTFLERGLRAGQVIWLYAAKILLPVRTAFMYPQWAIDPAAFWQYLPLLAAVGLPVVLWHCRARLGKAPFAAVLLYLINLGPALGFINMYMMQFTYYADHWQYLASMSLIALFAGLLATTVKRMKLGGRWLQSVACFLLLTSGCLVWSRARSFRDEETLWRDTLTRNPSCWIAHNNLGAILFHAGHTAEAIAHFDQAIGLRPDYIDPLANLGALLAKQGDLAQAVGYFERALKIKPKSFYANHLYGIALDYHGQTDKAIGHLRTARQSNPREPGIHRSLGRALGRQGEYEEARVCFAEALRLDALNPQTHRDLGNLLLVQGKLVGSAEHFRQALKLNPDQVEARRSLASILVQQGEVSRAIAHLEVVLRLCPNDAGTHNALGALLAREGSAPDAIPHFQRALELEPGLAAAHCNLGWALAEEGKTDEARSCFSEAIRLQTDLAPAHYGLGNLLEMEGRAEDAVRGYRVVLHLKPDHSGALGRLAWILATDPSPELRDGTESVRLAEQACRLTGHSEPSLLDVLAAAYAEAGRFDEAVAAARKACKLADLAGSQKIAAAIRRRLTLYESGRAFREGAGSRY